MKSIVTGGAGFIGSNLVDKLLKLGHKVIVIDNLSSGQKNNLKKVKKKIKFINADISSIKQKKLNKIFSNTDYVFHLAGLADIVPSITRPDKYFKANVQGTLNVLIAAKLAKIKKFIYAASASCYGIPQKFPTNENSEINLRYPYALTKYLGEKLVLHWANVYKMPNTSLRFFNVYGPRSRTSGAYGAVFGVFLAQKLAKKPLTIVGNGKQTRDFIHVYDVVDAIAKIIKVKKTDGQVYNLGSGKETNVNYIAKLISNYKIHIPKRPGEPDRSKADIKKLKKIINWSPKVNIKEGVSMLQKNLSEWSSAPVWTKQKIEKETKAWFKFLK